MKNYTFTIYYENEEGCITTQRSVWKATTRQTAMQLLLEYFKTYKNIDISNFEDAPMQGWDHASVRFFKFNREHIGIGIY